MIHDGGGCRILASLVLIDNWFRSLIMICLVVVDDWFRSLIIIRGRNEVVALIIENIDRKGMLNRFIELIGNLDSDRISSQVRFVIKEDCGGEGSVWIERKCLIMGGGISFN